MALNFRKTKRGGRSLNHRDSGLVQRDVDDTSSSKQIIGLTNNLAAMGKTLYINTVFCNSRVAMSDNSFATSPSPDSPKLLDRVRAKLRFKHYSIRTETAYTGWIKRFIHFHGKRHPGEMGKREVEAFLTSLAVERNVSAATQNQGIKGTLPFIPHRGSFWGVLEGGASERGQSASLTPEQNSLNSKADPCPRSAAKYAASRLHLPLQAMQTSPLPPRTACSSQKQA